MSEWDRLMQAMARYSLARREFLAELGLDRSNRDPLAEFSEGLVAALLGGTLATSRVQRGHDLIAPSYGRVQVRYLANPPGPWINEHHVTFTEGLDAYVVILFVALEPTGMILFRSGTLAEVGKRLGKRHPDQERSLQLTQANWRVLQAQRGEFAQLGVEVRVPPSWAASTP